MRRRDPELYEFMETAFLERERRLREQVERASQG